MNKKLFPDDLPALKWMDFPAEGFSKPVCGVIYRTGKSPCCGVPLGGIGTGCLDIDARGVYGFSSIFNPKAPHPLYEQWLRITRKVPSTQPILGLSIGGKTWVLSSQEIIKGGDITWCTDPLGSKLPDGTRTVKPVVATCHKIKNVHAAKEIHYWGHYPVVDMEFETDAPVSVGMRAWTPFIPGDVAASNIPAAVFEVHLRNTSNKDQDGTIAFNFPGPDVQEAMSIEFTRRIIKEDFEGVQVCSMNNSVNYVMGVIGDERVRIGMGLRAYPDPEAWSKIAVELPKSFFLERGGERIFQDPSSSAAVDFSLEPGQEKVVSFLLAWYSPVWEGASNDMDLMGNWYSGKTEVPWLGSKWGGDTNCYTQMYAARYDSALDVTRRIAVEYESLLARVLSWQEVVYTEDKIPVWLRDSLVNNLYLIAEDSYWAQAKPPLGDWCYPEGAFALNESPRGCPHMACIPCDWYGNLPIVFFYPELARSTLRIFKQYQREDGQIPFAVGKMHGLPDMATPEYNHQVSLNGTCYVDMVDRLWQRTGDDTILIEFYDSVKKCNTFTMNLCKSPGGVISMPEIGGMEWFEFGEWAGMATHMGGLRLAQLRIMERMAEAMNDTEYAERCRVWFAEGSKAMEEEMWTDSYYLNFYEKETGKKSDDVMAFQLDGEWAAKFHGLAGVFQQDRVIKALETIKRCNIALTPEVGAANFVRPDGSPLPAESKVAAYGQYGMVTAEVLVLSMTYMYAGKKEFGLNLARKHWENIILKQGHPWDLPCMIRGDTGERVLGTDYYQAMMLWALPAVTNDTDIKTFCVPGGFVDRIIRAGKEHRTRTIGR